MLGLRGKAKRAVAAEVVGELTAEDLFLASTERKPQGAPSVGAIQQLRHTHHKIARLLAAGYRNFEVAAMVGYSESRISILKGDPTFLDLIEFYSKQERGLELDLHGRLTQLTADALEALLEKVHDGEATVGQLTELAKLGADRVGHGPGATLNVRTVSVTGADLRALREEVDGASIGRLVSKANQEPSLGRAGAEEPLALTAVEGVESSRPLLREESGEEAGGDALEGRVP